MLRNDLKYLVWLECNELEKSVSREVWRGCKGFILSVIVRFWGVLIR